MKVVKAKGEGQGSCFLCSKRGKWNRQWMSFLYEIEGQPGVYCKKCVDELRYIEQKESRDRFYMDCLEYECMDPNG